MEATTNLSFSGTTLGKEIGTSHTADIQVKANHYEFGKYVNKARWNSFYYQIDEIVSTQPHSVLEIGVGSAILATILKSINCPYESMDIDPELHPDHIGSVLQMSFPDKTYDTIACFEVLEHLPYENFQTSLNELFRVAKKCVVLSLPDAEWVISIHLPRICRRALFHRPFTKAKEHIFDGEHYWEINKKGYEIKTVKASIEEIAQKHNFLLEKEYRPFENSYHHFFVLKRNNCPQSV